MGYRRGRDRRYRDDDYYVEEVYIEEDPYYYDDYDERPNSWLTSLIGVITVLAILAFVGTFLLRSSRPRPVPRNWSAPSTAQQQPQLRAVPIGTPKIDLRAVENALWQTKTSNSKDFKGWMKKFEDEVNAIYFATLRRQKPKADPATLMKKPARVAPQRTNGLLYIYGYVDDNGKQGYQNGEDKLLFVFQQTKPYQSSSKRLHYSLRDSSGYYYRSPGYYHSYLATSMFLNFFVYPTLWYGMWWRPTFGWWGTPYWNRGFFYSRTRYYYRSYPRYYGSYRRNYYSRHRPWGWNRGRYYRQGNRGRYYSRTSRYRSQGNRYRSQGNRYRSQGNRYRSRGSSGTNRYRSRGSSSWGTRNRYRSRGSSGTNRYRSRGSSSWGTRNRYRSRGNRYRSRRRSSWGSRRRFRYRSRRRFRSFGGRRR